MFLRKDFDPPKEAREFRRDLVETLALRTPWAQMVVEKGGNTKLWRALGVTSTVVRDAVALYQKNEDSLEKAGIRVRLKSVSLWVMREANKKLIETSKKAQMQQGDFVLAILHAAMQTEREPTLRPFRDGRQRRYVTEQAKERYRSKIRVTMAKGLLYALDARSRAFGLTISQYIHAWIDDLNDGKLKDLVVAPVDPRDTFVDEKKYRLPMVMSEELLDLTERQREQRTLKRRALLNEMYEMKSDRERKRKVVQAGATTFAFEEERLEAFRKEPLAKPKRPYRRKAKVDEAGGETPKE